MGGVQEQELDKLLDLMGIDFQEDNNFVIAGAMRDYKDKKGLKTMYNLSVDEDGNKISDPKELEKIIHSKVKKRIGANLYTYEKALESVASGFASKIGLWIPKGFIVIDTDTEKDSEAILEYIVQHNINTVSIKTKKGYHHIFKYDNNDITNSSKRKLKAGFEADYRVANNGYIILPYNDKHRSIIKMDNIDYMRDGLFPDEEVEKKDKIKPNKKNKEQQDKPKKVTESFAIIEGSRNDWLFRKLCGFVRNTQLREFNCLVLLAIGLNETLCNPPLERSEVEQITRGVIDNYSMESYRNGKGNVIPYHLAETVARDLSVISDNMCSYIYKGNTYIEAGDNFYKEIDGYIDNKELMKMNMVNEVTSQVKAMTLRDIIENSRTHINFKNGLFSIEDRKMILHTKNIITLGMYNGNYNENLSDITGTYFEQYLLSSIDNDLIPVVQEMLGTCLYPITDKVHYFYTLLGEGRNGKGVLLDIILNIIPANLRSGITMGDYDTRFSNASIKGKTVNICTDDKTTRLEGIGNLKSVTAGEGIFVEKKGIDGAMIQATLTHISSFNKLPSLQEKTNALFDRMIIIPFNTTFGTEEEVARGEKDRIRNPYLKANILAHEIDIIINWGMQGLFRVIDNDYKFTKPSKIIDVMDEYRNEADSVRKWIFEDVTMVNATQNSDYVKAKELYLVYNKWAMEQAVTPVGRNSFNTALKRYLKLQWKKIDGTDRFSVICGYNGQAKL